VPERRQPAPPAEQPAPEWIAPERVTAAAPAPEHVVVRSADPIPSAPAAEARPARAAPRKRAAPAAPAAGTAFQEHDQPSFLKRSTRKPKPEAKATDGDQKPE
jgi:hypothetical protein